MEPLKKVTEPIKKGDSLPSLSPGKHQKVSELTKKDEPAPSSTPGKPSTLPSCKQETPACHPPTQVSESDPSSSVSNSDPSSSDSSVSSNDSVPAFLTCNKCGLVLVDWEPAVEHEDCCLEDKRSMVIYPHMKVFTDKDMLIDFLIDKCDRDGGELHLRYSDEVYYHGPSDPSRHTS